jgi:hypothetical protein
VNYDVHTQKTAASNWFLSQVPVWLGTGVTFPIAAVLAAGPGSHTIATGSLAPIGRGPVMRFEVK